MTLKVSQISASAKDNEEKKISENAPWQKEGTWETGGNGSRLLLLVVTGKFPPRLPHLPKCPYTTQNRMDRQLKMWTRFSCCAHPPFSAEQWQNFMEHMKMCQGKCGLDVGKDFSPECVWALNRLARELVTPPAWKSSRSISAMFLSTQSEFWGCPAQSHELDSTTVLGHFWLRIFYNKFKFKTRRNIAHRPLY